MSYKIKRNCLKFSAAAFFLLILQQGNSQLNHQVFSSGIDARKKQIGSSIVVLVGTADSLIYKKEDGEFTARIPVPIGQSSQWLTAALILQFIDEGKISPDDEVSNYLPEFGKFWKNHITIRDCMGHTTGIRAEGSKLASLVQRKKFSTLEEEVNEFAGREIDADPGKEFRYSNLGLNIAARVLEVVTKKKFEMLVRQRLLVPLQMRNTTFANFEGGPVNPSSGAQSTATDYLHFLQMLLNKGMYKDKRVLSEAVVEQLRMVMWLTASMKSVPKTAEGFDYAAGSWVLESSNGKRADAMAAPGMNGIWPMVDFCHGYACVFFTGKPLSEQDANPYIILKKFLDSDLPDKCK